MTDLHQEQHKTNVLKPVLTGAAVGAVVAASAMLMSDEKKRKQVMKTVHSVKDKTQKAVQQAKNKLNEVQEGAEQLQEDAQDMAHDATDTKKRVLK